MHIAEGMLPLGQALAWTALAGPFLYVGAQRTREILAHPDPLPRALLGFSGALLFALTLFPIPVPVLGISSHLCATPVLALLLGWRALIVPAAIVLFLQALFFAHGGLSTLGANILTVGVLGPLVATGLFSLFGRPAPSKRLSFLVAVGLSTGIASLSIYLGATTIIALGLGGLGDFQTWWLLMALGLLPVQFPLLFLEGFMSVFILRSLKSHAPQIDISRKAGRKKKRTPGMGLLGVFLALSITLPLLPAKAYGGFDDLDEVIFEATAEKAGRSPGPVLDIEETPWGKTIFFAGFFLAGVLVGRTWERIILTKTPDLSSTQALTTAQKSSSAPTREAATGKRAQK